MKKIDIPSAAEFGKFRARLATMKGKDGKPLLNAQKIRAMCGDSVNARNWQQISEQIKDWLKNPV